MARPAAADLGDHSVQTVLDQEKRRRTERRRELIRPEQRTDQADELHHLVNLTDGRGVVGRRRCFAELAQMQLDVHEARVVVETQVQLVVADAAVETPNPAAAAFSKRPSAIGRTSPSRPANPSFALKVQGPSAPGLRETHSPKEAGCLRHAFTTCVTRSQRV